MELSGEDGVETDTFSSEVGLAGTVIIRPVPETIKDRSLGKGRILILRTHE